MKKARKKKKIYLLLLHLQLIHRSLEFVLENGKNGELLVILSASTSDRKEDDKGFTFAPFAQKTDFFLYFRLKLIQNFFILLFYFFGLRNWNEKR